MKMLEFMRPDGRRVWINPDAIVTVTSGAESNTLIHLTDGNQVVAELIDQVLADIEAE